MPTFNPWYTALTIGGVIAFVLGVVAYLILAERKVAAWVQDRLGPNRVGPWGLLQPIVDGGKMFLKEEVIPKHVDRVFFLLAPMVAFGTAMLAIAVVPFGSTKPVPPPVSVVPIQTSAGPIAPLTTYEAGQGAYQTGFSFAVAPGLDIGVLWVFAVGSLAVYGVILAGWSANSKYALLGSLRSSAQIISYEIPLGMSVVGIALMAGSLNPEAIIAAQARSGYWFVLFQPLAFLLFLVSVFAECNRLPFDLPESEQELVGGYHTEYSSLKLGMLLLAEYAHMITVSFLMSVLFFGGWHIPVLVEENLGASLVALFESGGGNMTAGVDGMTPEQKQAMRESLGARVGDWPVAAAVIKMGVLMTKMFLFIGLFLLVRWTIPRFRFDQLMILAWKVLIPLAIANVVCVVLVKQFVPSDGLVVSGYTVNPGWLLTAASLVLFVGAGLVAVRGGGSVTAPRRKVAQLPPGLPDEVTYASR